MVTGMSLLLLKFLKFPFWISDLTKTKQVFYFLLPKLFFLFVMLIIGISICQLVKKLLQFLFILSSKCILNLSTSLHLYCHPPLLPCPLKCCHISLGYWTVPDDLLPPLFTVCSTEEPQWHFHCIITFAFLEPFNSCMENTMRILY